MKQSWAALVGAALAAACGPDDPGTGPVDCSAPLLAGDLVITEVLANPAGTDTGSGGEYLELFNASGGTIDLSGVVLEYSFDEDLNAHTIRDASIPDGDYMVFAAVLAEFKPDYVDYGFGPDLGSFRNAGAHLRVLCDGDEIDSMDYPDMSSTRFDGVSFGLDGSMAPDHILNDNPASFCPATQEFRTDLVGSPGSENEVCQVIVEGQCNDGGNARDTRPPAAGDLVITEFMANPGGTDSDREWIEVLAVNEVDLNGVVLASLSGTSTARTTLSSPDCLTVSRDQFVLFAKSADPAENNNLPAVDFTMGSVSLNQTGTDDISLEFDGTVLDTVSWTGGIADGSSRQLDPESFDVTANDDPANFCNGSTAIGNGDNGTPGAANVACASGCGADQCDDSGTCRALVSPGAGDLTITEFLPNPAGTAAGVDAAQEWIEVRVNRDVDLNGVQLSNDANLTDFVDASVACRRFAAGSFALFAHSADTGVNGGLPSVDFLPSAASLPLSNTAGTLSVGHGGVILDSAAWGSGVGVPVADGAAIQKDDDGVFCNAQTAYGTAGNLGTPRAANDRDCP